MTPAVTSDCCWRKKLRSEEHTSEHQSRFDLVCRLLLEKKKASDSGDLFLASGTSPLPYPAIPGFSWPLACDRAAVRVAARPVAPRAVVDQGLDTLPFPV